MSNIIVSVCVLSYNHEKYLRDCLEGIVKQKTTFPIEAWVHDDASTDSSPLIIKEYQNRYPDIIKPILQTENQYSKKDGSIIAKFVYPICTGKYIALCEGDDYWIDPYKLQKQVDFLETHPDYSCHAHNSITLNTQTRQIGLFNKRILDVQDYPLDTFLTNGWFTPTASLLYRRRDYQQFDDMQEFMHGDYSLLINILLKPHTYLHYDNEIMSVYRDGGYASTHYKEIDLCNDFIALLKYYKEKSNHRCDEIFDKLIKREEINIEQATIYQQDCKKSRSIFVRVNQWLSRLFANIANMYVQCIYVTKKVERASLPNLEEL